MADDSKTDMTRYYYRPGTTEPELRPEVVAAEAEAEAKAKAGKAAAKADAEAPKAPTKAVSKKK
jgi:hypothetical protein